MVKTMEHVGCQLHSDYTDYYDGGLCCTELSHTLHLFRHRNSISMEGQMLRLQRAGLKTPIYGTLKEMCQWVSVMNLAPDFGGVAPLVIFNHQQQAELITLDVAKNLDPNQFAMSYIAPHSHLAGAVVKYLQIGTLRAWLYCYATDGWKIRANNCHTHLIPCNTPLPGNASATFHEPLFCIDFIVTHREAIAINFNTAPNLSALGLQSHFSQEDICRALLAHLDTSPIGKKEGAW